MCTEYHFLLKEDFPPSRAHNGEMLEYALVHGNYYGTLKTTVKEALAQGTDVLLDIDVQGAMSIRKTDDPIVRDSLVDVFIMPPTIEELEKRLRKRGTETEEQVQQRLRADGTMNRSWWPLYASTPFLSAAPMEEDLIKFRAIMRAERYLSRRLELNDSKPAIIRSGCLSRPFVFALKTCLKDINNLKFGFLPSASLLPL